MTTTKLLFTTVLVGLFGLFPTQMFAQQPVINVVTTIDYPGTGNSTAAFGINNLGDVTGDYVDASSVQRGFIRLHNGSFSPPIVAPHDTGNVTRGIGINDFRVVVGTFLSASDNAFHGVLFSHGAFADFDAFNLPSSVNGINDFGHLAGTFGAPVQPNQGYIRAGATLMAFNVPGAGDTRAIGLNNFDTIVGRYADSANVNHGYIRNSLGHLRFPIDFPGATFTSLNSINDLGWIVGVYRDALNVDHGFLLKSNTFVSFDFPNAAGTSLNGINDEGLIAGRYTDAAGVRHGFIARVRGFR
jgi:uncharacterized membrane protein